MPIYEFQCRKCSRDFEIIETSAGAKKKTKCIHCGSEDTRKLLSKCSISSGAASFPRGVSSGACKSSGGFS